jgi:hypothetical protein
MNTLFYSTLLALLACIAADPVWTVVLGNDLREYAILAASTITNSGASVVKGKVGLYPGSAITGFLPGAGVEAGVDAANPKSVAAQLALGLAYEQAAGAPCPVGNDLSNEDLGDMILPPGVYKFRSTAALNGKLTLNANGVTNPEWIFQIGSAILFTADSEVVFSNGGSHNHVTWQVGSSATLNTGASIIGNILAYASITARPDVKVNGRLLARNGAVAIDSDAVGPAGFAVLVASPFPLLVSRYLRTRVDGVVDDSEPSKSE